MTTEVSNNKRIAKNTLLLYVRMMLMMLISLYTSRVTLNELGCEDYGIYCVVGGLVGMFAVLNSSMATCTQRFLTYEQVRGDMARLKTVFRSSVLIHLLLSIFIVFCAETIGMWFMLNHMVIATERLAAAMWVFQFSVLSVVVGVMSVPYNAVIIAHEKMGAFAYISILEAVLKLIVVCVLVFATSDKLILFGAMTFAVSLFIRFIYARYSSSHFEECDFKFEIDKGIFKDIAKFAGLDFYGNLSVMGRTQGVNMLLNMFFGPLLNAASGVATAVQGAVMGFGTNVIMAVRPQIIKSCSVGEYGRMEYLVTKGAVLILLLFSVFSIPLIVETEYVLRLWLKEYPPYTVDFCRLTLMFNLFAGMSTVVVVVLHAVNRLKRCNFINGTLYLSVVPLSYFMYKLGVSPIVSYVFNVVAVLFGFLSNVWSVHLYIPQFSFRKFIEATLLKGGFVVVLVFFISYFITQVMDEGFLRLVFVSFISLFLIVALAYIVVLEEGERAKCIGIIKSRIKWLKVW